MHQFHTCRAAIFVTSSPADRLFKISTGEKRRKQNLFSVVCKYEQKIIRGHLSTKTRNEFSALFFEGATVQLFHSQLHQEYNCVRYKVGRTPLLQIAVRWAACPLIKLVQKASWKPVI